MKSFKKNIFAIFNIQSVKQSKDIFKYFAKFLLFMRQKFINFGIIYFTFSILERNVLSVFACCLLIIFLFCIQRSTRISLYFNDLKRYWKIKLNNFISFGVMR